VFYLIKLFQNIFHTTGIYILTQHLALLKQTPFNFEYFHSIKVQPSCSSATTSRRYLPRLFVIQKVSSKLLCPHTHCVRTRLLKKPHRCRWMDRRSFSRSKSVNWLMRESRPFGGRVPTQESSQQSRTLSLPTHIILGAAKHSATRSFRPNSQHATSGSAWIFDAPNPRQVAVRKQLKVSFSSSCAPLPPARPSGCVGLAGHRLR
jgi:hypothetical protein